MRGGPILCVDDDPLNLALLRQTLQESYDVVFATSGEGALRAVTRHAPSLILLDVQMPDLNGYEVCRRLKNNPVTSDIPVLFVTNMADVGDEEAGFEAGGVDYLTKPVSPPIVRARIANHLSLVRVNMLENSYRDAVFMLGKAGHYNDEDTGVHIWRMAAYSRALAGLMGWSEERCDLIEMAAPMHDTGKVGIPDAILKKPGPLTPEEWEVMKTHSTIGHDILAGSDAPVFKLAAEIALNHHERWDGRGYPNGLAGTAIPESARIVAVADVFDALSMRRPYKAPWPLAQVVATLRHDAGAHLEARLVDAFLDGLPRILAIKTEWDAREHAAAGPAWHVPSPPAATAPA
ncbi:response regulator [Pararhodospirillum oryzae]|uniref:Two-component system response regulator n=1 Tax=Pararhodospirillum oryzae TaxID=478448 RepID=A0A512H4B2_9PROT|nr:HD domain-containing phosphohydrolase [Pararhodospirillum oryzae]GEO80292.1 two-component system response regulator [Pararhodospirillum oryzae]